MILKSLRVRAKAVGPGHGHGRRHRRPHAGQWTDRSNRRRKSSQRCRPGMPTAIMIFIGENIEYECQIYVLWQNSVALIYTDYTGLDFKAVSKLRECCRQVEAEVVSISRNKVCQTLERSYSPAQTCSFKPKP